MQYSFKHIYTINIMSSSEPHSRILTTIAEMYSNNNNNVNRLLDQNQQIIDLFTQIINTNVPTFRPTSRSLRNRNTRPGHTTPAPNRESYLPRTNTTQPQTSNLSNVQFFRSYLGSDNQWHNEPLNTNTQTDTAFQNLFQSLLQPNLEPVVIRPTLTQITNGTLNHTYSNIQTPIDERCSICLSDFNPDDAVIEIRCCHHLFHSNCLLRHFDNGTRCPMCRHDIRDPPLPHTNEENTQNTLNNTTFIVDSSGTIMNNLDASDNIMNNLDASGNIISNNTNTNNNNDNSETYIESNATSISEILTNIMQNSNVNESILNNNVDEIVRILTRNADGVTNERYTNAATNFLSGIIANPNMTDDEAIQHAGAFFDALIPPLNATTPLNTTTTPNTAAQPNTTSPPSSTISTTPSSSTTSTTRSNTTSPPRRITTRETRTEVENLIYDFFVENNVHQSPTMPTMSSIMSFPGYTTFMRQLVSTPQILQAADSNDPDTVSNIISSSVQNVIATISYERIMNRTTL